MPCEKYTTAKSIARRCASGVLNGRKRSVSADIRGIIV